MTTTAQRLPLAPFAKRVRWLLIAAELAIAVNAVGGGVYGLAGARDVPREWLEGTPFDSYVIPSLILLIGVGGAMTTAALSLLVDWRHARVLSVGAGAVLAGWITAQVLIIVPDGGFSWLQPTMFAAGVFVAAVGWRLRPEHDTSERSGHVDPR
jgi:hypothetical protein